MKIKYTREISGHIFAIGFSIILLFLNGAARAQQDSTAPSSKTDAPSNPRPVKNTFQSQWIIDNQTVMVPVKGTLEVDFQHRFGVLGKGYQDFFGVFSPSFNIRFGASYTPIKNLSLGIGFSKSDLLWDGSAKYAIFTQTPGKYPVSLTFFGDMAINTLENPVIYDGTPMQHSSGRYSFFSSLIVARKISDKLSVQVTPSISWQNTVGGYYTKNDSSGTAIYQSMWNYHFAVSVCARYKISANSAIIFDYDQPLTSHPSYNPYPNLGLGIEVSTSGHAFQLFVTNYSWLNPQYNNLYNNNAPFKVTDDVTGTTNPGGQWLIGFNITKLWNY